MNLAGIDLNLLVAFEALLQERSVTRAAAQVGLTQPAMSNALARLRAVLQDPLFRKKSKEMVPTPRALELAAPIRSSLAQLRVALTEERPFDPPSSCRTFTISVTDYIEFLLIGPLLRQVIKEGPHIKINSVRPDQLFHIPETALREGAVDAAIGFFPNPVPISSEIRTQTLFEEENVCIARLKHPRIRTQLTIDTFVSCQHVGIFYRDHGPGLVDTSIEMLEFHRNLGSISRHFLAVPFIVAESDLVAVVPTRIAVTFKRFLPLRIFSLPFNFPKFPVRLAWLERNHAEQGHMWLRKKTLEATCEVIGPKFRLNE